MNNIIHIIRHTARAATVLLLALLTAQTARAQELTDFLTVSSSGTASGYFAFSDHFYKVDWTGINTSQTTSVQLNYNPTFGRLTAQTNGDSSGGIMLYTNADASTYWMASDITGLTPGQSSDGYTSYTALSVNAGTKRAKVCTVTCMAANTPTWNWSADYSTCTATFTCTASPSLTTTVNATVTTSGSTATASATFNGTNYTDTKTIVTNYSITYVLNGGTNAAGNPTTYADNVGVASFANPTRTGYQFGGWYDNASFTGSPVTNIPAGSSGDKTLYAKWNIGLTYNTTGGYYEISNAQDLVVLANYVNDGNKASGMTFKQTQDINMGSIGNFEPIGSQPNSYNPTPFNGTYDGQGHAIIGLTVNTSSPYAGLFGYMEGGSVRNLTMVNPNVTSNDNSQGYKYAGGIVGNIQSSTIENCNVINPTLKTSSGNGYNNKGAICGGIIGGYCVVTDCYFYTTGNVSAVGANPLNVSVTASRTYTLTLGNGITTSTAPTFSYAGTGYYASGTTITLSGLSDRTGYTSDYAASGNVTVTDNQFAMPDGDVTVTAVYTPITYTITYHAGEGVDFSTEKNAYTVESATITLDQPSPKTGYTFSGWYGNASLTGDAITAIATGSTGNMELWAKWTANTYTVHFVAGIPVYGEMADQTFTYDQAATALTKNAFSTTTGQWLRWNTKADGSGTDYEDEQEVQNLTAEDGGVVTLYAQWRLTHRFTYDNTIFHCYKASNINEVHWAYAGETVKVEVIDGTSEYTIRVVNGNGEAITLDTETNTFVMPNEEVWITYTSVKRMSYTTISLDNFESGDDVAYLYDASQPTVAPTVVVKDGETVLTEGTDYTVEITNNTGSATQMVTATVTVTGMGGYVGTNTREFRITPFNIANCDIKGTLEAYDDGYGPYYPLCNNVEVWNGDTKLTLDTDYTIELDPNIGTYDYVVGEQYQATIKGTGDWGGTKTFTFTFVALHHTVVFVANGGSGTMASDVATKGQHYTLPPCGFTAPDGKKFDHWVASCEPDAEKQPGDYFTAPYIWNESDVQTITVTAYWRDKATCTVTLPEEMEVVSGTLTDGKAIEDEVITFRPRPGFTATDVQANGTALTPDGEGIYTLTVTADVTVTATFRSSTIDLTDASGDFAAINNDVLTGTTSHTVTIANGASITLNNVAISGGIVCDGTAEITLVGENAVGVTSLDGTLIYQTAGIQIGGSGTTLTIKGDGSLTATGGSQAAGIGLGRTWDANATGGSIVIESGTVTASGGNGIGAGHVGNSKTATVGDIIIKGGTVNARLGSGYIYNGSSVTIGAIKIYDTIDKVDASAITESVIYMHVENETETDVTANKADYFTIIEDGDRRVITPKDDTDYTITIADDIEHGSIACAATTAKFGDKVTITATPDFGYRLSNLVVKDAENNDVASTGNSFFMPNSNVTVSAVFEQGTHGTTEFAWSHWGSLAWETDAIIYDGITTVNMNENVDYSIIRYDDEHNYSKFLLDNNTRQVNIPYAGGTGIFQDTNPTVFRLNNDGESGFYDITMTDVGNGKWSVSILKTVGQMDNIPDQTYTGSEITPEPLVLAGSLSFTKGTDYEYSYTNNTNVGTATVRATFQGTYASLGYVERTFTILPPPVVVVNVTGNGTVTYNDKSAASGETIGVTAEKGTDVTLTLTPGNGYAVRSVEYGYTNSNETTMNGAKLPINGTTATLTVPNDLKDGTYVNLTVTFVSALVGGADEASAVALTDNTLTDLAGGWYKVDSDITFDHTLSLLGETYLTIAEDKTMTVNTASNRGIHSDYTLFVSGDGALSVTTTADYEIAICVGNYVQTGATVTASGYIGIRCTDDFIAFNFDNDFTFSGGQLTATGSGGDGIWANNTITLGWTNPADRITASSYDASGTVKVADGKALTDGSGHIYTGTLSASVLSGFAAETTLQPCLALADAADNTAAITDHAGKTLAVALSGRTLYKDGSWNTLCLPFDVTTASGTLSGDNVQAMTLDTETSNLNEGTLTLNFDDATGQTIPAGTPFIIKWDNTGDNIENPVFDGVTISNATNDATVTDVLTFTGTYAPVTIPAEGDKTKLYLGAANTLYYPNGAMTIGCHRAYFQLAPGITAGEPTSPQQAGVRAFVLNFGEDNATGIVEPEDDSSFVTRHSSFQPWYTIDGRKLDGKKPTQRGIYIHKGHKIVIK